MENRREPILQNNLKICLLLVVSSLFLLVVGRFRSLQVVSYSLWVISGRLLLVLDHFGSFLVRLGRFRSFLACCRSFQVVSDRSSF